MRTASFIAMAGIAALAACTADPTQDPRYQQLEDDTRHAEALVAERDSTINSLLATFNRIGDNLRTIRARQGQLTPPAGGVEQGGAMEERIMGDIEGIDGLLAENRTLIQRLREQIRTSAANIGELERTVAELEKSITEKDREIEAIKEELASTNSSLATLIGMYREQVQRGDIQHEEMSTAWYAVGTARELRENGVLTREGGLVGIGAGTKLNVKAFPRNYFTRIDVGRTQEIALAAKKARLATPHPEGSYRFEGGARKLSITDPEAFWSISKYLVVVVE